MAGPFASVGAAGLARHFVETLAVNLCFSGGPSHGTEPAALAESLTRAVLPAVEEAFDIATAEFGDLVFDELTVDLPPLAVTGVTERDRAALREALLAAIRAAIGREQNAQTTGAALPSGSPAPSPPPVQQAGGERAPLAESHAEPAEVLLGPAVLSRWTPAWLLADPDRPGQVLTALRDGRASLAPMLDGRSVEAIQVLLEALIAANRGEASRAPIGGGSVSDFGSIPSKDALISRLRGLVARRTSHSAPAERARDRPVPEPGSGGIEALARQLMEGELAVAVLPASLSAESLYAIFEAVSQARQGTDGGLLREAVRVLLADNTPDAAATLRQVLHALLAGEPVDLEQPRGLEPVAAEQAGLLPAPGDAGTSRIEPVAGNSAAAMAAPANGPDARMDEPLLQRLREGSLSIDDLAAGLAVPALADLFHRLAGAAMGEANAARLADAASAMAASHPVPAEFWRHLLAAMASNQPLDLEAAADAAGRQGPLAEALPPLGQGEADDEAQADADPGALLGRLREGSLSIDDLAAGLAVPALADLFHSLAGAAMGEANAARLSDAASAMAAIHPAPAEFWRHLLAAMASNQPLDLEAAGGVAAEKDWPGSPHLPGGGDAVPQAGTHAGLAHTLAQTYADLDAVLRGVLPPGGLAGALARMPSAMRYRLRRLADQVPGLAALILAGRSQPEQQAFSAALGGWTVNPGERASGAAVPAPSPGVPAERPDAAPSETAAWLAAALADAGGGPAGLAQAALSLTQLAPQDVWHALLRLPVTARLAAVARLPDFLTEGDLARFALAFPAGLPEGWLASLEALWTAETQGLLPLQQRALFWQRTLRLLAGRQTGGLVRAFAVAAITRRSAAEPVEAQASGGPGENLARSLEAMAFSPLLTDSTAQRRVLAMAAAAVESLGEAVGPSALAEPGGPVGFGASESPIGTAAAITSTAYTLSADLQGGQVPQGALGDAVERLQDAAPLLLHRVWTAAAANPPHLNALTWKRSEPELRVLLAAALGLMRYAGPETAEPGEARANAETLLATRDVDPEALRRAIHRLAAAAEPQPRASSTAAPEQDDAKFPAVDEALLPLPDVMAAALRTVVPETASTLAPLLQAMLLRAPAQLAAILQSQTPAAAVAAILALAEADRARLLAHLAPGLADNGLAALEWLTAALPMPGAPVRAVAWTALAELALTPPPDRAVERYGRAVLRRLSTASRLSEGALARQLAAALAPAPASDPFVRRLRGLAVAEPRQAAAGRPSEGAAASGWWTDDAGIVLLSVYLPRLYEMRGLVAEGAFLDAAARTRARALTRYAIWGDAAAYPDLAARRDCVAALLCGLEPNHPYEPLALAEEDAALVEGLLQAVIANWTAIGNTSVPGLREAFLQRPGVLRREAENWRLRVEGRAYDMLVDRLPWSYGTIRHRWMEQPLIVDWRP